MLPYYLVISTHNDVLLFLEYYISTACCFNDTRVITLSQDHQPLQSQNYYGFTYYSHESKVHTLSFRDSVNTSVVFGAMQGSPKGDSVWATHRVHSFSNVALERSPT